MSSNIEVKRTCEYCGKEFTAKTTVTRYCSHTCNRKAYKARQRNTKLDQYQQKTTPKKVTYTDLQDKDILTVKEAAVLLNCSLRTLYRLIETGRIPSTNLGERLTRIRKADIDKVLNPDIDVEQCYTLAEIIQKYGISDKALYDLIKRHNIPKIRKGWYVYVQKDLIDKLLS